jgi:hypothetical protein
MQITPMNSCTHGFPRGEEPADFVSAIVLGLAIDKFPLQPVKPFLSVSGDISHI